MSFRFSTAGLLLVAILGLVGCDRPSFPADAASQPAPPAISQEEFVSLVDRDAVTLVKFGATWCPPCHAMDANLEQVADRLPATVQTRRVDTDANAELASQLSVSSIPHTFLFKNGRVVDDTVGVLSPDQIVAWVDKHQ